MSDRADANTAIPFEPWCSDYLWAVRFSAINLLSGPGLAVLGHPYLATIVGGLLTKQAYSLLSRGLAREKGMAVEREAVSILRERLVPEGYGVESNIDARFIGNIDCIVNPPWSPVRFVVEIKAYEGIERHGFGLSKLAHKFLLFKDVRQVRSQCRYMRRATGFHHYLPVLWMPKSKVGNWFRYGNIMVVNGDYRLLELALWRWGSTYRIPACVSFPYQPPRALRQYLMAMGFRYKGYEMGWLGWLSPVELESLRATVSSANGRAGFRV
jgi:hypothetical protein